MRLTTVVLALMAVAPVAAVAQDKEEKVYTVTVSGEAVMAAVPDKALISLTVQGQPAKKRREAEENQSRLAKGLVDALKAAGVADRDIKSQYYQLQDYYEQQKDGKNERKGYFVVQQFQVRVSRERASAVLDQVPDFANVGGVQFYVSNTRALQDEATNSAIDDAKQRAKTRAERLGITLGPILAYQEGQLGRPQPQMKTMAGGMSAMADEAAPELPAGEDEIHASVTITYRINVP